uniref:Putative methyltransferase n=1 Tax=viral metagenome TaxID=1070528 RepID=A0A6H2A0Z5_9ZZZZ
MKIDKEFKNLIPKISKDAYAELEKSIVKEGCRDAICLWQYEPGRMDGIIIDGHNRYEICQKHNLPYDKKWIELKDRDEVKIWILTNAYAKRNLTPDQLSAIRGERYNLEKKSAGRPIESEKCGTKYHINTSQKLAEEFKVNEKTIRNDAKYVDSLNDIKTIDEEFVQDIKDAEIDIPRQDVIRIASKPISEQKKIIQKVKSGEKLKDAEKELKKDIQKKLYTEASKTYKPNTDIQIHNVDFREYAKKIEDNSIDLILTDPPYPKEFLPLWKDLAVVAERILKPGKFLIAYSGQLYLNEIFTYFKDAGLEYYWLAGLWHKGSTAIVNARNVINEMKPILIYCKPPLKKNQNTFIDMFISEKKNKDLHEWGQNIEVIELLIEKFSAPNDLIFEPFAGSGTTLTASKTLKRKCIGCETDKEMIDIIRGRVQ